MGGLLLTRVAASVLRAMIGFALLAGPMVAQQPAPPLTVEKIYGRGGLIGNLPGGITWSPDGKHVTYIDGGELIDLDPGSGKPHVLVSRAKLAALGESVRDRACGHARFDRFSGGDRGIQERRPRRGGRHRSGRARSAGRPSRLRSPG